MLLIIGELLMNVTIENALQVYQEYVSIKKLSGKLTILLFTLILSAFVLLVFEQTQLFSLLMILFVWIAYSVSAKDKQADLIFKELVGLKGIEVCRYTYIFENRNYSLLRHEQQGDKVVIVFCDSGFMRDPDLQDSVRDFNQYENTQLFWTMGLIVSGVVCSIGLRFFLSDEMFKQYLFVPTIFSVVGIFYFMFILGYSETRKKKFIQQQGYQHLQGSLYEKDGKTYEVVVDYLFSYREVPVMTKII